MGFIKMKNQGYIGGGVYFEASANPTDHDKSFHPSDTVKVPLRPSHEHVWNGSAWDYVAPDPAVVLEQERAAMQMSREKFAVIAAGQEWITEDDAEAWVAGNAIPSVALTAINSRPEGERFKLRLSVRSQAIIRRNDMLIGVLMALKSVSVTDMDELFRKTAS